jgi:hypothetical protein
MAIPQSFSSISSGLALTLGVVTENKLPCSPVKTGVLTSRTSPGKKWANISSLLSCRWLAPLISFFPNDGLEARRPAASPPRAGSD